MKHWFFFFSFTGLIVLGLCVRFIHLSTLGFEFDMVETFYTWATAAQRMGLVTFWHSYTGFFDYMPGALLMLYVFKFLALSFSDSVATFVLVVKSFNLISDIVFSLIVAWVARRHGKWTREESLFLGACAFVLPSIWFTSVVWGQIEMIVMLCLISSLLLLYKDKPMWGGFFIAMAFWIKLQVVLFAAPIIVYFFIRRSLRQFAKMSLGVILWVVPFSVLLILLNKERFFSVLSQPFLREPRITRHALTLWSMIYEHNDASVRVFSIGSFAVSVTLLGTIITLLVCAVLFFSVITKYESWRSFFTKITFTKRITPSLFTISAVMAIASLAYYLFMTKVHERYLFPALVFTVIMAASAREKWSRIVSITAVVVMDVVLLLTELWAFVDDGNTNPLWPVDVWHTLPFDVTSIGFFALWIVFLGLLSWIMFGRYNLKQGHQE